MSIRSRWFILFFCIVHLFPSNSVNYFKKGVAVSITTVDLFILLKSLYLPNWFIIYLNSKQYGVSSENKKQNYDMI